MISWDVFTTRDRCTHVFCLKSLKIFVQRLTGTILRQRLMNVLYLHRKEYFAIQYYGECRSYRNENRLNYTALGISHKSWAGLGGPWTNCVYQFV